MCAGRKVSFGQGGGLSPQPPESGQPQCRHCVGVTKLGGLEKSSWGHPGNPLIVQLETLGPGARDTLATDCLQLGADQTSGFARTHGPVLCAGLSPQHAPGTLLGSWGQTRIPSLF